MKTVIVPNHVRDAINAALDKALEVCPDAVIDRDIYYHELLNYFDQFGTVPDFELQKHETPTPKAS